MKQLFTLGLAYLVIMLSGCTNKRSNNLVEIDASKFPVKTDLVGKAIQIPEISTFGITEIKVVDSIMVVSVMGNENFWHFYSLPDMDSIGSYFNIGNGPYEFPAPIPCFQSSFCKNEQNETMAYIPLPGRHKMAQVNLSNMLTSGNYEDNYNVVDIKAEQMPLWTYCLDQSKYLQAVVNPENNSIERSIRSFTADSISKADNEFLDFLNSRKVESMENLQLLLTTPAIGQDGNMVAEIPGYDNQIVVYDTSGADGVFIKYKDIPSDKTELALLAKQNLSPFGGGYGYDDFFTLIRNEIEDEKVINQHLDFISWDGTPLGSINTGMNSIRRFDLDQANGGLYCIDGTSDEIKAYDVKAFLKEIHQIK